MRKDGFCEYCQTEQCNGFICETIPEKDLINHETELLGKTVTLSIAVEDGELVLYNFDFEPFVNVKINYCPMCGRKLNHLEEIETEEN